jgi:leader peptidase (prepilin peptidase) / N-methyltransferase
VTTLAELVRTWAVSPFAEVAALLCGLLVGSFANVCIHRLPLGRSVVFPSSRCPACGGAIRSFDNVPILSWLLLRGRCRSCRASISIRYPAVEAVNGLLWGGLVAVRGPSLETAVDLVLITALLVLSLIDLEHQILPDVITRPGIVLGLLASFLPGWPIGPRSAAAAALAGYVAFLVVAKTYEKTRGQEGLGQGDWKMAALLGAFLGWQKMLLTVFLAALSGTVVGLGLIAFRGRDFQFKLPFGTFLGAAGIVCIFAGDPIVAWYRSFFG